MKKTLTINFTGNILKIAGLFYQDKDRRKKNKESIDGHRPWSVEKAVRLRCGT